MKKRLLLLLLLFYSAVIFAVGTSIIKGTITDKRSNEPLTGAVITLKNVKTGGKIATSAGLDGSYLFRNVSAGDYELEGKFISYSDTEITFTVAEGELKTVNL
ncbi:MAG: carboxypeptidase regulatory-like domain-containing protein [Janthinobacterium lividum]